MVKEMLSEKQLLERRNYIGGSDVSGILGWSPWTTPLSVYLSKIGESTSDVDTSLGSPIDRGNRCEKAILRAYSKRTGNKLKSSCDTICHTDYAFLAANIDAQVNDQLIVEAKTASNRREWGEDGSSQIPEHYLTQVAFYSALTGAAMVDIPVLFFKRNFSTEVARQAELKDCAITDLDYSLFSYEFAVFHYKKNEKLEELLINECVKFWNNHVMKKHPPAATDLQDVAALYKTSTPASCVADTSLFKKCKRYREIKDCIDKFIAEKKEIELDIKKSMGEKEIMVSEDGEVLSTWKSSITNRFDTKKFKTEHPFDYSNYINTTETRRFLVKEIN